MGRRRLRLRSSHSRGSSKSYVVLYRPAETGTAANVTRLKIGKPETITSAKEARRRFRAALGKIVVGENPVAELKKSKGAQVRLSVFSLIVTTLSSSGAATFTGARAEVP